MADIFSPEILRPINPANDQRIVEEDLISGL